MERFPPDPTASPRDAAVAWFTKLRDPQLRKSEHEAFLRWREADAEHAAAYAEIEAVWSELDAVPAPAPMTEPKSWGRFLRPAIAAALALLAIGTLFAPINGYRSLVADERTGAGESRAIQLPDGSEVWLDAASALSFEVSADERRATLIAGRAFFTVQHEQARPFLVTVGGAQVRDIGTAFEITKHDLGADVTVSEGIVEVSLDAGAAATLHAGQGIAIGAALGDVRSVAIRDVAAWRTRRMVFIDTPLRAVTADLERYGAGRIFLLDDKLAERRITGAFDTRAPADALAAIVELAHAQAYTLGSMTFLRSQR